MARDRGREHAAGRRRDGCRGHDHRRPRRAGRGPDAPDAAAAPRSPSALLDRRAAARAHPPRRARRRRRRRPRCRPRGPRASRPAARERRRPHLREGAARRAVVRHGRRRLAELVDPVARAVVSVRRGTPCATPSCPPATSCDSSSRASGTRPSPPRAASRSHGSSSPSADTSPTTTATCSPRGRRRCRLGARRARRAGSDAQLQFVKAFTRLACDAGARRRARRAPHRRIAPRRARGRPRPALGDRDRARALGAAADDEIDAALAADDTAKGRQLAETARAARPDQAVKDAAWRRVATDATLSNDLARAIADGWQRTIDPELLARRWRTTSRCSSASGRSGASRWPRSSSRALPGARDRRRARRAARAPGSTRTPSRRRCTVSSPSSSTSSSARSRPATRRRGRARRRGLTLDGSAGVTDHPAPLMRPQYTSDHAPTRRARPREVDVWAQVDAFWATPWGILLTNVIQVASIVADRAHRPLAAALRHPPRRQPGRDGREAQAGRHRHAGAERLAAGRGAPRAAHAHARLGAHQHRERHALHRRAAARRRDDRPRRSSARSRCSPPRSAPASASVPRTSSRTC